MADIHKHFVQTPVGPEDPIAGIRGDAEWENAWLSAVALAWSSPELQQRLIDDPRGFFLGQLGYNVPAGLTLYVRASEGKDPDGRPTGWDPVNRLWYLHNTELVMYIPPPPELKDQALALSAYAATGRTYPFTCG